MVDFLVGDAAVVLQDVVVRGAGGLDQLLSDGLYMVFSKLPPPAPPSHRSAKSHAMIRSNQIR